MVGVDPGADGDDLDAAVAPRWGIEELRVAASRTVAVSSRAIVDGARPSRSPNTLILKPERRRLAFSIRSSCGK
jgi:hypothetical protein